MNPFFLGFAIGVASASAALGYYLLANRFLRTRSEHYAAMQARGLPVPEDWYCD